MRNKFIAFAVALATVVSTSSFTMVYATQETTSATTATEQKDKKSNLSGDYVNATLFDNTKVHKVNIIISDDEWKKIDAATSDVKEYATCDVEIDGELFKNVAVKGKGHASIGYTRARTDGKNNRIGLRIKFNEYDKETTYHGLNKLSLNNIAADPTCMKDFIAYNMMRDMGVCSPLCSYTTVQKNGKDFAMFLAVEDIDKSFAIRNYGNTDDVELYQPESEVAESTSDLMSTIQVFSGRAYKDKDQTDRVDPWEIISNKMHVESMKDNACSRWVDDKVETYQNVWDSDNLKCTEDDQKRYIEILDKLNNGTQEEALSVMDTEQLMRYWAVHGFMNNEDSLVGKARSQNFYLVENNGKLSYVPWDYNAAFGGFDARIVVRDLFGEGFLLDTTKVGLDNVMPLEKDLVNMPIDNPNRIGGTEMLPLLDKWITVDSYKSQYHDICRDLTNLEDDYKKLISDTSNMIAPYVKDGLTFYTEDQFNKAIENLNLYMKYRFESYRKQTSGETPSTWEGQKQHIDTLIEPDGLDLSTMASNTSIIGTPPASIINPSIKAIIGNNPCTVEEFSNKLLDFFDDNFTLYDRIPEMLQTATLKSYAIDMLNQKYNVNSLFFASSDSSIDDTTPTEDPTTVISDFAQATAKQAADSGASKEEISNAAAKAAASKALELGFTDVDAVAPLAGRAAGMNGGDGMAAGSACAEMIKRGSVE